MEDAVKVNIDLMFLINSLLLWWQGRSTNKRYSKIETWKKFQNELKGQFYPKFVEEEAREKLNC